MIGYNYYLKLFLKIIVTLIFLGNIVGLLILSYVYFNGLNKWQVISAIPAGPRRAGKAIIDFVQELPYLKYHFFDHGLPEYELFIKRDNIAKLDNMLIDPTTNDYIKLLASDAQIKVGGTLMYKNREYEVKAGYRGRQADHWLWPKKSWEIDFKKFDSQNTLENFELIVPSTRGFAAEALNFYRARKFDLAVPDYEFVWLKLNGEDKGVYFKTGPVEKYLTDADNLFYREGNYLDALFGKFENSYSKWRGKEDGEKEEKKVDYAKLSLFLDLLNGDQEKYNKIIWQIMDKENFVNWAVFTTLAGSTHQDWIHNIRLYFNEDSNKFRIVPFNVEIWPWISPDALFVDYNPMVTKALSNDVFLLDFEERIWNYVSDEKNIKADLDEYDRIVSRVRTAFLQDTFDTFGSEQVESILAGTRRDISNNANIIRKILDSAEINILLSIFSSGQNNDQSNVFYKIQDQIKSNSILQWSGFTLSGLIRADYNLEMYADQNGNGQLDKFDARVGYFRYDHGDKKYYFSPTTLHNIYPKFLLPDPAGEPYKNQFSPNTPLVPLVQNNIFFIKTNIPLETNLKDVVIESHYLNIISGSKVVASEARLMDFRSVPKSWLWTASN